MAFFVNHFHLSFFFLLITRLSSLQIHARDSQFFNKISTNSNYHNGKETKVATPNKDQEPNFIPDENEKGYGIYDPNINSHEKESRQLPQASTSANTNLEQSYKSTTANNLIPNNKYLPKNYNPVAYVTAPQDNTDDTNFINSEFTTTDNNQYYNNDITYDNNDNINNQYYNGDNIYHHYYRGDSTYDDYDNNNNNQYYSGSSIYNDQYNNGGRAASKAINSIEPSLNGDSGDYYNNNNNNNQLQDLSESRLMDKGYTTTPTTTNPTNTKNYPYKDIGKSYYYNNQEQINYSTNYNHYNGGNGYRVQHQSMSYTWDPYENSREFANSYANNELSNYNNNFVNYENEDDQFQDEEHMP
ncbi:uncharacterized protein LOC132044533 [Lycium ferocissimum]|uniref:uncharacterized protein LOC132044533 n=1 Tax=Lycium ferocissimum TaxID=112874 RepID=UPI002814C81B|nr:uncharacterized protein LOC132044533 [Lycium ferocissimum]